MMRIKLFGLFIAYAVVALVRPREMRKMLDAADRGVARNEKAEPIDEEAAFEAWWSDFEEAHPDWRYADAYAMRWNVWQARAQLAQECPLPPAGWRCTRRAGHDGPCAAVVK